MRATHIGLTALLVLGAMASGAAQSGVVPPGGQVRDRQAQPAGPATGTGIIAGRVVTAGSGLPAGGVRVTLNGAELRGTRTALTDDDGVFAFPSLPAGTFTVRGTRTGHISGTYGQKQPGLAGTPISLAAGQQMKDVSVEIARGGVISGIVFDEKSRPSVSTPVRVMQWTMQSGERVLTTSGNSSTDDRGIYRVFGLAPGEYLVYAVPRNEPTDVIMAAREQELAASRLIEASIGVDGRVTAGAVQRDIAVNVPATNQPVPGYAPVFFPGRTGSP